MKKNVFSIMLISVLLFSAFLLLPQSVYADPPQNITLNYNLKTQTLTVTLTHKSFFPSVHYIKQIEIKKNGELIGKNDYTAQTGKTTFAYTYNIPAAVNDVFEITASCNVQGRKTATLKVQ